MQIYKEIKQLSLKDTVITTGNFDGVHLGHQFLLKELVSLAKNSGRLSVVVMFYPHPREVLSPEDDTFRYLSSQEDKYRVFEECGIDVVVQIPFSKELAKWTAEEFVTKILLDKLGMSLFLVGYDHRLGNPKADTRVLPLSHKYGFEMKECRSFETEYGEVSSSIVRESLAKGDVKLSAQLLGRPYTMECIVEEGRKVGRSIGYPTANLKANYDRQLLPSEGVYAVKVMLDAKEYGGMMQIGYRPTLNDGRGLTVEVHIFDFNQDIYGHTLSVYFVDYLRANKRFSDIDALREQLKLDEHSARKRVSNL